MKQRFTGNRFKSRKTPERIYPTKPPELDSSLEAFHHAIDETLLDEKTKPFQDRIVTIRLFYQPGLLAHARTDFHAPRWDLHHERDIFKIVPFPPLPQLPEWDAAEARKWNLKLMQSSAEDDCSYVYDETHDFSVKRFEQLLEDFLQFLTTREVLEVTYNPTVKIARSFEETDESYFSRCMEKLHEDFNQEIKNLQDTAMRLESRLKQRLDRETRDIPEHMISTGDGVVRKSQKTSRKASTAELQSEMDAREAQLNIEEIKKELEELEKLTAVRRKELEERLENTARQEEKDLIRLGRSGIQVLRFGLIWLPHAEVVVQENESRSVHVVPSF